ncbi:hypothetical protein ACFE04_029752 [Oxalis oulophora]
MDHHHQRNCEYVEGEDEKTKLQWLWIIEYLSTFKQITPSILHDLIQLAPELPEDLGKRAVEMVALRCLEDFFPADDGLVAAAHDKDSKCSFDLSLSCVHVLETILQETSEADLIRGGAALLKWDVLPFIGHKRASMPKCALQELKDAISDDNHTNAASSEKHESEKIAVDGIENNLHTRGTGDRSNEGQNMVKRDLLQGECSNAIHKIPSKRNRSDLETENVMGPIQERQDTMNDSNDLNVSVKKLRHDTSSIDPSVGKPLLPPPQAEELVERSDLQKYPPNRDLEETHFPEDSSKMPDIEAEDLRCGQTEVYHNASRMQSGTVVNANDTEQLKLNGDPSVRCGHNDSAAESIEDRGVHNTNLAEDNSKFFKNTSDFGTDGTENEVGKITNRIPTEQRTMNDEPFVRTEHKESADELNYKGDHDCCPKLPDADSDRHKEKINTDEMKDDENHINEEISPFSGETADIAKKKSCFLDSQFPISQNLLMSNDSTEQNICVKCSSGNNGELLVCGTSTCPLKIHESCLGCPATFDEKGNFNCPFCAYSRFISEYLESKKETSLARRDLATFIQTGFNNFPGGKQNNSRKNENKDLRTEVHHQNQHVVEVNDERQSEHSASHSNLEPPRKMEKAKATGENVGFATREKENSTAQETGPSACVEDEALQQRATSAKEKAVSTLNSDGENSSNDEENKYFISIRNRETQCTSPPTPKFKRKKVPWTPEEVDMLKKGIEIFSGDENRAIPWREILLFGNSVFLKLRTPVDLKDKWKNICKANSKIK